MAVLTSSAVVNAAIADAKSLPDLADKLSQIDPAMAQQITGKALIASKTPWGTVGVAFAAWLSARYGLGWDPDVDALVGGFGALAGAFLMRWATSHPITGLFTAKAP